MKEGLYRNQIHDEDSADAQKRKLTDILSKIQQQPELEAVYLSGNKLSPNALGLLETSLMNHNQLRILDLSANPGIHKGRGMKYLKNIIDQHPDIRLFLTCNDMTDDAVRSLVSENAADLASKIRAITIDFSCNDLTEGGITSTRRFLSPKSILSMLSGNFIRDQKFIVETRDRELQELAAAKR